MADNLDVMDEPEKRAEAGEDPVPRPDLADQPPEVTYEDRQLYGRLLDSAMERGLLDPHDYEVRLGEIAGASSTDEMRRIVTELPIFSTSAPTATSKKPSRFLRTPAPRAPRAPPLPLTPEEIPGLRSSSAAGFGTTRGRSNPWTKLMVLLIVVIVVFVLLSIYAEYVVQNRNVKPNASAPIAWRAPPPPPPISTSGPVFRPARSR